jgi:hypothetical protein
MISRCLTNLVFVLAALGWSATHAAEEVISLAGVIDLHCHTGPDTVPRSVNDFELARLARDAGMRGLVLKNHFTPTGDRAQLVMREVPGLEVFGGIVLNRAVGGLNAEAVRRMIAMEGKRGRVVWLPTFDAECQVKFSKENRPFVSVVRDGRPVPELAEIFQLIAQNDLVLATGHSSADESVILVDAAKRAGVKHLLITHVLAEAQHAKPEHLRKFAEQGAFMEITWSGLLPPVGAVNVGLPLALQDCTRAIATVGAEHFFISSDLGQAGNPLHPDGLRAFIATLRKEGVSDREIDLLARKNPARLLGLEP